MSRRDDDVCLNDMLSHADEAVGLLDAVRRDDFATNRVLQLALTRLMEIVGEAANRVSDTTRAKHARIPWLAVIGMRNRLIHGYDVIDWDILWDTVHVDLPPLIADLESSWTTARDERPSEGPWELFHRSGVLSKL